MQELSSLCWPNVSLFQALSKGENAKIGLAGSGEKKNGGQKIKRVRAQNIKIFKILKK